VKEIKRIKGSKLETELNDIIAQHERFKNSYFWSPPANAAGRRQYEERNSRQPIIFQYDGSEIEIKQSVSCSCRNIYYNFSVHVDGQKKDIRFLKQLVK